MEIYDIVDENDNLTGETGDRDYVHNNNLFHRHASCWILNKKGEVLLQRRSLTKKRNPGVWAKTGGHIVAGESVDQGLMREIKEEIGLDVKDGELIFINKYKSENPNYYSYNYVLITDKKVNEFILQIEELDKVEYFSIEYLEEQKRNNNKSFSFSSWKDEDFYNQMNILKKYRISE